MVITMEELIVNGELIVSRKETYGKSKKTKNAPVFTSRMEKHKYDKSINYFDIRNVLDVKGFLIDIRENWNTYVSQVSQWIQKNPIKKLIVTGIFTIVLSLFTSTANACIQEYTYQMKSGESIENIAARHGVTAQQIVDANGLASIDGKKILLPKVQDRTVTATILNIRSQPSTASSIIGKYKKGDVVKVSFIENGWAGILINGRVCFVSANYLTQNQAVASTASQTTIPSKSLTKTMYVTASSLRIRDRASISSAIIGSLKNNDRVTVTSTLNGWAQIHYRGRTAFISEAFLTDHAPKITISETNISNITSTNSSMYVIKSGDNFTKISKSLGVSVTSIQELNPTVNSLKLKIGQKINVPITTSFTTNQLKVDAQIGGVDPEGTFRFITSDGGTYAGKASGNMINDLFELKGNKVTLTLEGIRGQQLTLISIQ